MLQHSFIFTLPAQRLPGYFHPFSLCLFLLLHPSDSQGIPAPFPPQTSSFYPLTPSQDAPTAPTATFRPMRSEGGLSVARGYAGEISISLRKHFQQGTKLSLK